MRRGERYRATDNLVHDSDLEYGGTMRATVCEQIEQAARWGHNELVPTRDAVTCLQCASRKAL